MCGIIGYLGEREIVPVLVSGLKRLEYRGYDSAGICVSNGQELQLLKKKGKLSNLEGDSKLSEIRGNVGIAHTRWATHGEPNEINAHPHLNKMKDIAIIHNGIIENFSSLKEMLQAEGYEFVSDTDSEVLVHLVDKFYEGDLKKAVLDVLRIIEGTYGLLVMHKKEKKIIAARKGSPLILGIGEGEMFLASDVSAVLEYTRKVIYLNDGEVAEVRQDNHFIEKLNGEKVDSKIDEIKWSLDQVEKKGFKHFMLKEIFEQPASISNTLRGRVLGDEIKLSINLPTKLRKIVILACGTSWHSGLIGKYLIENLARVPVEVDYASEFRYRSPIIGRDDLVVVISQSGETADTLAALREAKSLGAKTLAVVNVVGSTIAREVDSGIYLHAGPEIGVASTKAFTCQISALLLLALHLKQNKGENIDENLLFELIKIPEKIKEILRGKDKIREIATEFVNSKNFLFLGRGLDFPVALEGALKLKEISYIHAEGYPAAEMKHGPIALIDENMPVAFLATKSHLSEKVFSNMQEVKARKGRIIAVTNPGTNVSNVADFVIEIPETHEYLSPLLNVIPLQLLSYYIADFKGLDVDKPRNLAKSVTVE